MKYPRFSELWDVLVTKSPNAKSAKREEPITNGMSAQTESALIAYANGDKSKFTALNSLIR